MYTGIPKPVKILTDTNTVYEPKTENNPAGRFAAWGLVQQMTDIS